MSRMELSGQERALSNSIDCLSQADKNTRARSWCGATGASPLSGSKEFALSLNPTDERLKRLKPHELLLAPGVQLTFARQVRHVHSLARVSAVKRATDGHLSLGWFMSPLCRAEPIKQREQARARAKAVANFVRMPHIRCGPISSRK